MTVTGRLVVQRPQEKYRDSLRAYHLEVDGAHVGEVRPGESVNCDLSPGSHSVRACIDWTGSPTIEVDVPPGGSICLRVEATGASGLAALFKRESYLRLIKLDD